MKRLLVSLAITLSLATACCRPAMADGTINTLSAGTALAGTELIPMFQTANPAVNTTPSAIKTYVFSLVGGDLTCASTGFCTFATVNANVGSFGSATNCPTVTVNAKGLVTAASATTCTPAVGSITGLGAGVGTWLGAPSSANLLAALTTKTGTGNAVFGTAPTIDSLNATTAMTLAFLTGSTQCLQVNTSGVVSGTGAACGSGGSGITSLTPGKGLVSSIGAACSQSAITTTGTLSAAECVNAQSGTSYIIVDGDRANLITGTNAAAQSYTIGQAGTGGSFQAGWFARVQNKGAGPLTITPTTSTICGAASLTIYPGQTQKISSDGTNYQCDGGTTGTLAVSSQTGANYAFVSSNFGQLVNLSNASNQIPTLPQAGTAGFPAGWYVQACNQGAGSQTITPTTSTIGGAATFVLPAGTAAAPKCVGIVSDGSNYQVIPDFTVGGTATVASGTAVMGTSAIASGACATVVTVSATGVATTDVITASFNGDPTAVTGYIPATTGMLTIIPYPTANNVNFKTCNNTSSSVTPGAITLNWRVVR
jgi:hypothetical protein